MTDTLNPLLLDLVEWIAKEPRLYSEVLDAWRTSCPRLTVWEDAVDRGYVQREPFDGRAPTVKVTPLGHTFLQQNGLGAPDFYISQTPATQGKLRALQPERKLA